MKNYNFTALAPVVVRLGMAFVFIWFGASQLYSQDMWLSLIPSGIVSATGLSAKTLVIFSGTFEVILATLLAFGIKIRIVATLLFLHLIGIVLDVGFGATGIRDIGLALATLSVALHGADAYSFDKPFDRPKELGL